MIPLFLFLQQADIEKKISEAPDMRYEIGVFIGTYLPFVVLILIAYWMYSRAKKRSR